MNNISVAVERKDEQSSIIKIYVNGMAPVEGKGKVKYQRLRLNAGTIPTKDWDFRAGRPSASFSKRDGGTLHRSIDLKCLYVQRAYLECLTKTAEAVRDRYDELLGLKRQIARTSTFLLDIVRGWINRGDKSAHTLSTYVVFSRKVEDYERKHATKVDLAKATTEGLLAFLLWSMSTYRLAPNTMASMQKMVNMALNEVRSADVSVCKNVKLYAFRTPKKDVLEWSEIARVINHTPKSRTEANAQTILVALCLSGARISDTWLLLKTISMRGGVLCSDFTCTKNADRHPVAVSPIIFEPVRSLLEKNGIPEHISDKHIRISIKKLLVAVGIEKSIEVHSLRRSFVSLFLSLGVVPDHLLARCFSGHAMSSGAKSIFHAYNHATMTTAQRTVIQLLRMVPENQTGGIRLLSEEVCAL